MPPPVIPVDPSLPPGAIGGFIIGESAIGGYQFDWEQTIISQYANSEVLLSIIESFNECVDQTVNINAFYDNVWNILTAQGYGLDVWGRIVVVKRTLTVVTRFFGFAQQSPTVDPYNVSPFYSGQSSTQNYVLSDDAYRVLILAKALANICDGTINGMNQILQLLFPGRGACYVVDNGNMTMTYTFDFALTPVEVAIITTSGVLPRPTGVSVSYSIV